MNLYTKDKVSLSKKDNSVQGNIISLLTHTQVIYRKNKHFF